MKRLTMVASIGLVLAALVGFSWRDASGAKETAAKDVFCGYLTSEPASLDPARGVDVAESSVQAKLFNGLVRFDDNLRLVGDLAESWEISPDGKTYTFKLRPNLKFHDGTPCTAADVAFSFERVLDPATRSPRTWVLDRIVGAKDRLAGKAEKTSGLSVTDGRTVVVTLEQPFAPFISLLAMPAAYVLPERHAVAIKDGSFFGKPFGTGPFVLSARERDRYLRLERNTSYHGETPAISALQYRVITEPMKAELEFESGALDILQLYPSNYDRFSAIPENVPRMRELPAMNVFYMGLNNQKPPFNDVRVRQALNHLIDRQGILEAVYKGRGVPARGSIPPSILGHMDGQPGYDYDPARGEALLKEAGYSKKNPLRFELFQKSSQAAFEITQLLQGELRKAGVEITLRPMEWGALKEAIDKGEALAFYLSWFGDYPDGENFLVPLFHSRNFGSGGNRAHYANPKVDALLDEVVRIQDPTKRAEAYDRVHRLIVAEAPWVFLWHLKETYLLGPRVSAMTMNPMYSVDKGTGIHLAVR